MIELIFTVLAALVVISVAAFVLDMLADVWG